jgi:hypothetical protein
MPYVLNCTNETQKVKVLGNFFEFAPKQMKRMKDELATSIDELRREQGMVALPDRSEKEMDWPEYKKTPEGKLEFERLENLGLEAYITKLRWVIYNNQVSLRSDLEKSNIKHDPSVLASERGADGVSTLDYMKVLSKYQSQKDDLEQKQIDEVKELMRKVNK